MGASADALEAGAATSSSDSLGWGAGVGIRREVAVIVAARLAAISLSPSAGPPTCVGCSLANSGRPSAICVRSLSSTAAGTAGADVPVTRPEPSPVACFGGSGTGDLVRGAPTGPNALRLGPVARRPSALWLSSVGSAPEPGVPAGGFGAARGGDDGDDSGCVGRASGDEPMPLGDDAAKGLAAGPGAAPPMGPKPGLRAARGRQSSAVDRPR